MRKMFNTDGERLHRTLRIKVFTPGNGACEKHVYQAPPTKGFNAATIEQMLKATADKIETAFPEHEYQLVELGPATFNFVWKHKNKAEDVEPLDGQLAIAAEHATAMAYAQAAANL